MEHILCSKSLIIKVWSKRLRFLSSVIWSFVISKRSLCCFLIPTFFHSFSCLPLSTPSLSLYRYVSISHSFNPYISVSLHMYTIYLFIYLSVSPSICLSLYIYLARYVSLSILLYLSFSLYLSLSLFLCLSLSPFISINPLSPLSHYSSIYLYIYS